MNIVESKGKKFDIDTVDGAEAYLKSEGVDIVKAFNKEFALIQSRKKLNGAIVNEANRKICVECGKNEAVICWDCLLGTH